MLFQGCLRLGTVHTIQYILSSILVKLGSLLEIVLSFFYKSVFFMF